MQKPRKQLSNCLIKKVRGDNLDFFTRAISRRSIRELARLFHLLFGLSREEYIPVVELLDRFCEMCSNVCYDIVENDELPRNVPALTELSIDGQFTIKIKQKIYEDALFKQVGGYRNHIMHEICHVFLCILGFTPILHRTFANNVISPINSSEWQTKALCGEIMMPYEETSNMSAEEIAKKYKVSLSSAEMRKKY